MGVGLGGVGDGLCERRDWRDRRGGGDVGDRRAGEIQVEESSSPVSEKCLKRILNS